MEKTGNNKMIIKVLCYIGLVFLIILLIIPPVFRLVFKEEKNDIKKNIVITMKCSKENENVASTFLNNEPQVIQYDVVGNYVSVEGSSGETKNTGNENLTSELLTRFSEYGPITYDEDKNISIIKFDVSGFKDSADYELLLRNQPAQEEYFKSQGFSCIKQTIEQ